MFTSIRIREVSSPVPKSATDDLAEIWPVAFSIAASTVVGAGAAFLLVATGEWTWARRPSWLIVENALARWAIPALALVAAAPVAARSVP